jgi:hypothetical protein
MQKKRVSSGAVRATLSWHTRIDVAGNRIERCLRLDSGALFRMLRRRRRACGLLE